jgi:hypothetical protein
MPAETVERKLVAILAADMLVPAIASPPRRRGDRVTICYGGCFSVRRNQ